MGICGCRKPCSPGRRPAELVLQRSKLEGISPSFVFWEKARPLARPRTVQGGVFCLLPAFRVFQGLLQNPIYVFVFQTVENVLSLPPRLNQSLVP